MTNPLRGRSGSSEETQIRKKKTKQSSLWEEFDKDDTEQPVSLSEEENELQQYLSMPRLSHDDDPLKFWRVHETHFRCLVPLAKKMLGIPPTSAKSEHVFSCAGNIVVPTCSCLDPEKVNVLVFFEQKQVSYLTTFVHMLCNH